MKKLLFSTLILSLGFMTIQSCGPTQEEIQAREAAVKDSLAKVEADRLAQIEADRLAQAEADRLAAIEAEKEKRRIEFSENGKYTVQVEASRGMATAETQIAMWKKRGFPNSYIVKFGDEAAGDVWFRVRLGRFGTKKMANKAAALVFEDYKVKAWVTAQE